MTPYYYPECVKHTPQKLSFSLAKISTFLKRHLKNWDVKITVTSIIFDLVYNFRSFGPGKIAIETDSKRFGLGEKLTTNKNSTIFELWSWNLVKLMSHWGNPFDQVA